MADATLTAALKQAKGKKMFFAFIPKGADGKLIVSKTKIPPKDVADAKKETGGGTPITGKCFGEGDVMAFEVARAAPATLGPALKKVAKRDTGLNIDPDIRVAGDADADDGVDIGQGPAAGAQATAAQAAAPAAPPAASANVLGIQKALQKLGYGPSTVDGVMSPDTQAAIKKFQQANGLPADGTLGTATQAALAKALRGGASAAPASTGPAPAAALDLAPWQAARQNAISELKTLASKVAASKHPAAVGVIKEIQTIIGKLPASPKAQDIDKLQVLIETDDAISAADESPKGFHDVNIRKPLLQALQSMKQ